MSEPFPPPVSSHLIVEKTEISGPACALFGVFARPSKNETHPGILMIHDRNGADEHNREVAGRLASAGYAVLLIDLYSRGGGTETISKSEKPVYEAAPIVPREGMEDLIAALEWLKS